MILMDAEEDAMTNFEIDYYRLISFWVNAHKPKISAIRQNFATQDKTPRFLVA